MRYFIYIVVALFCMMPGGGVYAQGSAQGAAIVDSIEATPPTLTIFHSLTCPHCRAEREFLTYIEGKYPTLRIMQYEVEDAKNIPLMRDLAKQYGAERELGNVPLTFVGDQYFVGYQDDETSGKEIEQAVRHLLQLEDSASSSSVRTFTVPFVGTLDPREHSYAFLAIVLGILDGFNVCSLGALVLIIGLALKLQSRRAILLFGGAFIGMTAMVYGGLIVLWYQIFDSFSAYMTTLKVVVAMLSVGGGLYFLKEYLRMRTQGPVCDMQESTLIQRLMDRTSSVFEQKTQLLGVLGAVMVFATVLAIVEFPCSAAVPVVFAGMLADAGLSTGAYLGHIGLFVLFYMLDELIIFGVAAYRLKLWMMNGSFTKNAALAEALILLGIGAWYLSTLLGLL